MKKVLVGFLVIISFFSVQSQEQLPFVENFTKSNYSGDNQVWSVVQGNDNAMYFANNHFFIRYNGVRWEKYSLPNKTILRSVFADGDRIYSGSYNEFGYWKRINGEMMYSSLTKDKNLFSGASINEEIWKIFKHEDAIYFQSFNELHILKNNKIKKVRIPFQISYCFVVQNTIYAASVKNGIYRYENNKFSKVTKWANLENNVVHALEKNKKATYIFTQKNGVFVESAGKIMPWNNVLNAVFKKEIIITAKFIDNYRLAVGTAFQGVYIIDLKTNTYKNINRNNALKNNSVLCIGFDKENDLWLGLDNGIAHVEINSPISIFSDNTGILGSVYTMASLDNGLLLGSNHGVFSYINKKLQLVPNSQGQVWDIQKIGEKYVIGHNDGTFVYESGQFKKVNAISGGWKFTKSNFDNKFFQANYSGIIVYNSVNDFSSYQIIPDLTKPIKNIAQNKPRELWAVDNYRSLYRITFNNSYQVTKVENTTQKNNIVDDYNVKIFDFKNEILFFIKDTWYQFNDISGKLEKNEIFNTNFASISEIIPYNDTIFFVIKDKLLYMINHLNGKFIWEQIPEKYYEGKIINQDTKVFKDGTNLMMNLDDGFLTYSFDNKKKINQNITIEAFYNGQYIEENAAIEFNQSIEFDVISEFFGYNRSGLYYKLNDSNGYTPIKNGSATINNIPSGKQEFKVYYNDGEKYVLVKEFQFSVNKPWYFSFWMIIIYLAIISSSFYLYYRWNKIRYLEKLKLKEEELKHQKDIIQLEMDAQNRLKLQEYENHILEVQIQAKASEVASKSLSIAKQTEMIESILKAIEQEHDLNSLKSSIKKVVKINSLNKNEWISFEKNLLQSNEDFVKRVTTKYPILTSKDIKLCVYLKMNLSSKEIAPLMNISYRGVELHRYRLRKKIGLSAEESLSKFMINI